MSHGRARGQPGLWGHECCQDDLSITFLYSQINLLHGARHLTDNNVALRSGQEWSLFCPDWTSGLLERWISCLQSWSFCWVVMPTGGTRLCEPHVVLTSWLRRSRTSASRAVLGHLALQGDCSSWLVPHLFCRVLWIWTTEKVLICWFVMILSQVRKRTELI